MLQVVLSLENLRGEPLRRGDKREQYQTGNVQDNEDEENSW